MITITPTYLRLYTFKRGAAHKLRELKMPSPCSVSCGHYQDSIFIFGRLVTSRVPNMAVTHRSDVVNQSYDMAARPRSHRHQSRRIGISNWRRIPTDSMYICVAWSPLVVHHAARCIRSACIQMGTWFFFLRSCVVSPSRLSHIAMV